MQKPTKAPWISGVLNFQDFIRVLETSVLLHCQVSIGENNV